ncbi:hypothetical protein PV797_11250 [Clostridiaceae bacterium M8S5]|nr:hypothetical protein PV797_11250 [Clostridiaceae bacterium M8S5]
MRRYLTVFNHELRYFRTLHRIKRSILIQIIAPAIFTLLNSVFLKTVDLRIAVLIMILGVIRIPMALMGYSIGGEKVYKTFESIMSTPISVKVFFIGKSILPIIISGVMFITSSVVSIISVNVYARYVMRVKTFEVYNLSEIIIIFGNGLLIVTLIMFLTSLLTLKMKAPRTGMVIVSFISFLVSLPYINILYFNKGNALILSLICMGVLFIINLLIYVLFLQKITVASLFSKVI